MRRQTESWRRRATHSRWAVATLGGLLLVGAPFAQTLPAAPDTATATPDREPQALPEVSVQAAPLSLRHATIMDPTRAITTIGPATLAQRQAASVFELLDEVPGLAYTGGPRSSGMGFSVRGYTDTEDVTVLLDGVSKGFEKYRFGGTFIEPDLLKTVEVRRGAQIDSGAGALGGTVSATTKDAVDLLRPGERLGARLRWGWGSNNHERHRFAAAYARPGDWDLVAAQTQRQSSDMRLPDGSTLPLSATDLDSSLLKASWVPRDDWRLSASWVRYSDQALQPYDASAGSSALFGTVLRRIQDETTSLRATWQDDAAGHSWQATLGQSSTRVRDHADKGMSIFATVAAVDDDIAYQQRTADTRGSLRLWGSTPDARLDLVAGWQHARSERDVSRVTSSPTLNTSLYPGGFNAAQPPGSRQSQGHYLQLDWQAGRWQVLPGMRWDTVAVQAEGKTLSQLALAGQPDAVRFHHTAPSLNLAYALQPGRWTVFSNAATGFRPPLIDEVFMQGGYGACTSYNLTRGYTVRGYARNQVVAPSSGICANAYEPETSRTLEWGLSTRQPDWWGPRSRLDAKLTAYANRTEHLLESLMAEPGGSGRLVQPGVERRRGVELEASLRRGPARVGFNLSRIRGRTFDGERDVPLATVPGDSLQLSLGWAWPWGDTSLRWQHVARRTVVTGTDSQNRSTYGDERGHRLLGATFSWAISPHVDLALSGENLGNTRYRLSNGFGNSPGTEAPGRNLRISLSARI